jgi:hypothetical protein
MQNLKMIYYLLCMHSINLTIFTIKKTMSYTDKMLRDDALKGKVIVPEVVVV